MRRLPARSPFDSPCIASCQRQADEVGNVTRSGGDAGAARQDQRCGVVRERERAAELHNSLRAPAAMVPRPVIVVVPLTMTLLDVAAPMSVVVALAMVCVVAQLRAPVMVSPALATAPTCAAVVLCGLLVLPVWLVSVVRLSLICFCSLPSAPSTVSDAVITALVAVLSPLSTVASTRAAVK